MMTKLKPLLFLMLSLLAGATNVHGEAGDSIMEARPVGGPLDDTIISVYVPPTRANNVYAATRSAVHLYSAKMGEWRRVFPLAGETAIIAGVAGYAKASSVIYVAHDKGVSVSHDTGETWETAVPDGYHPKRNEIAQISVNPTSRDEAVVCASAGAWFTKDYGKTWTSLPGPAAGVAPVSVMYVAGQAPGIVASSKNALYTAHEPGAAWKQVAASSVIAAVAPSTGTIVLADQKNNVKQVGGNDVGKGTRLPATPSHIVVDNSGAVWSSHGGKLYLHTAGAESAAAAANFENEIGALVAHPRAPHALVLAAGKQVYALGDIADTTEATAKDDAGPEPKPVESDGGPQALLDAAKAASPPLPVIVDAALDFADYHAGDVDKWRKHVRIKNLLPTASLELGQRQWPAHAYNTAYSTNQYGITTANDISQNDTIENLDRNSVQLRWDFSKLLYDAEQLHISEEARRRATDRNALIKEVTQLYYKRLELLVKQKQEEGKAGADESLQTIMQLSQSTDLLNEICGRNLFGPSVDVTEKSVHEKH